MIRYNKLFALLTMRGMKKTDLLEVISSPTLAKLSKGDVVKMDVIEKICKFLDCQPGEIMEFVDEEAMKEKALQIDEAQQKALALLQKQGMTLEQIKTASRDMNDKLIDQTNAGENAVYNLLVQMLSELQNAESID